MSTVTGVNVRGVYYTTGLENKQDTISDLATIRTGAANGTTAMTTKQDVISDLATIRSGASAGATALQTVPAATDVTFGGVKLEWDATNLILNIKTV